MKADVKVLISYGRKLELETKEKELAQLKRERGSSGIDVVKTICNHIEEYARPYSNSTGGKAAKYHALVGVLHSVRTNFLDIPPISR